MFTTLFTLFFACGDAEETKEIPQPPEKPAEVAKPEAKAPTPTKSDAPAEEVAKPDASGKDGGAVTEGTIGGTKPEVKTAEKLMTTKEIQAPQSKLLTSKVERMLKAKAQKEGFQTIKNFKLIKNECKAGGVCTGIGQGTAVKTTILFVEGNGVAVVQEDKSTKDAIISKVDGNNFTVKYADGSEATVERGALSMKK